MSDVDRRPGGHAPAPRPVLERLVATPFVASWVGHASGGDRFDLDPTRRASGWATWAMDALCEVTAGERSYAAIRLDSRFYDPKGSMAEGLRPHLELSERVLGRRDEEFAHRLSQMGNALAMMWLRYDEVTAIRRSLLNVGQGRIADLLETLGPRRAALADTVDHLAAAVRPRWDVVERLLAGPGDGLAETATADFGPDAVNRFVPGLEGLNLSVHYDERLRTTNGSWAARRVGIWQLCGTDADGEQFKLGVLTPRLTSNSLFGDPLFATQRESAAALLVRGLLLGRLAVLLGAGNDDVQVDAPPVLGHLRAVPAKIGAKIPEASSQAAVHFLQCHPDPDNAWRALTDWAGERYVLAVSEGSFKTSHTRALRSVRRAEDPRREDIDSVLPLAWRDGRAARVTFSLPPP